VTRFRFAAFTLLLAIPAFVAPVHAQDAGESVNQLIIYGDDPCPRSTDDTIVVCARKAEAERYRIPEPLRGSQSPQNDAWNNRVLAYETIGKNGTLSCSPVGGGGWTGCVNQMISTAYAEKDSDPSVRFGELIAAERARRLATIDSSAKETQELVEEEEKAQEARKQAERAAREAADAAARAAATQPGQQ